MYTSLFTYRVPPSHGPFLLKLGKFSPVMYRRDKFPQQQQCQPNKNNRSNHTQNNSWKMQLDIYKHNEEFFFIYEIKVLVGTLLISIAFSNIQWIGNFSKLRYTGISEEPAIFFVKNKTSLKLFPYNFFHMCLVIMFCVAVYSRIKLIVIETCTLPLPGVMYRLYN